MLVCCRTAEDKRHQRDDAIRDLESRPYRSPEEEDRLGRLRLDSEFEKRAEQARKETDRDSDDDQSLVMSFTAISCVYKRCCNVLCIRSWRTCSCRALHMVAGCCTWLQSLAHGCRAWRMAA